MCDTELADNRNQMDLKIDPHQAYFFQNIRCSILRPYSILPRLTIYAVVYVDKQVQDFYSVCMARILVVS